MEAVRDFIFARTAVFSRSVAVQNPGVRHGGHEWSNLSAVADSKGSYVRHGGQNREIVSAVADSHMPVDLFREVDQGFVS